MLPSTASHAPAPGRCCPLHAPAHPSARVSPAAASPSSRHGRICPQHIGWRGARQDMARERRGPRERQNSRLGWPPSRQGPPPGHWAELSLASSGTFTRGAEVLATRPTPASPGGSGAHGGQPAPQRRGGGLNPASAAAAAPLPRNRLRGEERRGARQCPPRQN